MATANRKQNKFHITFPCPLPSPPFTHLSCVWCGTASLVLLQLAGRSTTTLLTLCCRWNIAFITNGIEWMLHCLCQWRRNALIVPCWSRQMQRGSWRGRIWCIGATRLGTTVGTSIGTRSIRPGELKECLEATSFLN